MLRTFRQSVAALLILCVTGWALPLPAQAAMLATDSALASADKGRIAQFLDRADVRAQLQSHGVSPADAKARVAALTDDEAAKLAGQIDSAPAGGDGGAIIGAAIIVFLVLLLTDYLGYTHIFPFMKGHTRSGM
ncbi:MAG TPA: PA2779 family protein [Burkholderiales bacterium]|nr:PA2779 family protein [Burkholderiales bacterium]